MEAKKTPKADLERKKGIFFQTGLIFTLAVILLGFEWKSYDKIVYDLGPMQVVNIEEEIIPITRQEAPPPPPTPTVNIELNIVDDETEVTDQLDFNAEADATTEVEEYTAPVVVEEEKEVVEQEIFTIVEEMASFPNGEVELQKFITSNVVYPQMAKETGVSGTVYVQFVVEPDGSISNIKILKGIGAGCDEEAVRVVKKMPKWKPGKQRSKPVRVYFNLPIRFTLAG